MPNIIDGFIRAIVSSVIGIVISVGTRAIISDLLDNEVFGIIASLVIFAISLYIITSKMKYWGIIYTIGWFVGLAFMYYALSSIIDWYEIVLYLVVSGIILYGKLINKLP